MSESVEVVEVDNNSNNSLENNNNVINNRQNLGPNLGPIVSGSKKKKKKKSDEMYRNYNPDWEVLFGFLKRDNKTAVCAMNLCKATMSHRSYNIKRHFTQTHEKAMREHFGKTGVSVQQQIRDQVAVFKLKNPTFRLVIPTKPKGYNPIWTSKYGFVMKDKQDSVCTICNQVVLSKAELLESHFNNHLAMQHFPKNKSIQEHINQKVKAFTEYHALHMQPQDMASSFETKKASLIVALAIAKMDKTYLEGEFIGDIFLQMSEVLFANYTNKEEILNDIKRMSISRASIRRNIDTIVEDINQQLNDDLDKCESFSIRLDQSVSRKDVARLAVTVRFFSNRFHRLIEEVLMVGKINGETTKESDSFQLASGLVQKFDLQSKLFSICVDGARSTTAQIFVTQIQQLLGREILVFNTPVSMRDTFLAILNNEPMVPVRCSVDVYKTLKFLLFPEQFYYSNLEGNFLDFEYFKFLGIESFYRELDQFCAIQTLLQQFQLMRQEIFNSSDKAPEVLTENWRLLKKPSFLSMLRVFEAIFSIFGDDPDDEGSGSGDPNKKKKKKNKVKGVASAGTIGSPVMNPYRNRLKMNNTEIAFRLNLTNYSPDFNRILIKRRPLTFDDVIPKTAAPTATTTTNQPPQLGLPDLSGPLIPSSLIIGTSGSSLSLALGAQMSMPPGTMITTLSDTRQSSSPIIHIDHKAQPQSTMPTSITNLGCNNEQKSC